MKVDEHPFKKHAVRLFLFFSVCLLAVGVMKGFAQDGQFAVERLLQSASDASIVAIEVKGSFERNDVLNVYTNDRFIKSKVIEASDAGGSKVVVIKNISVDVLRSGENDITVAIERRGEEVLRTEPFRVTIQNIPDRPVVVVAEEADGYKVTISGSFQKDDIVAVFLNDVEEVTVPITDNLVESGDVSVTIPFSSFFNGDNRVEALVRRGTTESGLSSRETVTVLPSGEERSSIPVQQLPLCFSYNEDERQQVQPQYQGRGNEFGTNVSITDTVAAIGDVSGRTEVFTKIVNDETEQWNHVTTLSGGRYTVRQEEEKNFVIDSDQTVLVGTATAGYQGSESGVVEVFTRSGDDWSGTDFIAPMSIGSYERFGRYLAVDGDTLVVSAARSDIGGGLYVYNRNSDGTSWENPTFISPRVVTDDMQFGVHVALEGGMIAVGAPGASSVYVYTNDTGRWVEEKVSVADRERESRFGQVVTFADGRLVVGAPNGGLRGTVYIYERGSGNQWQLATVLSAPENARDFGAELAYDSGALAIGAPRTTRDNLKIGAVFVFVNSDGMWRLQDTVMPSSLRPGDRFGTGIAMLGNMLVVGAPGDDSGESSNAGTAYFFSAHASVCSAVVVSAQDETSSVSASPQENVEHLQGQQSELEVLSESVMSLLEAVSNNIVAAMQEVVRQEEHIVIFDEELVSGLAQRRAATVRGVTAPFLPPEVTAKQYEVRSKSIPTESEVRSRIEVVNETLDDVGIVVPVTSSGLGLGDDHEDVYRLQVFLNQNGYTVAKSGPGSPGGEVSEFTASTESALKRFQLLNGIPQTGILDKKTRDAIFTYVGTF